MLESYLSLIKLGSILGTFLLMYSLGLNTTMDKLSYFKSRRSLFYRSAFAVSFLVPVLAALIILVINPEPAVAVALAILAASPVAPTSFSKIPKVGGSLDYVMNLNVLLAILSIIVTPLILFLFETVFNFHTSVSPIIIGIQVSLTILLPMFLGMLTRRIVPNISMKAIRSLEALSILLNSIAILLVLIASLDDLFLMSLRSYLSMFLMAAAALLAGHVLSSDTYEGQTSLALECAFRNPGLALMIAALNYPGKNALPVLIPYLLIVAVISAIYIQWRKRYMKAGKPNERPV